MPVRQCEGVPTARADAWRLRMNCLVVTAMWSSVIAKHQRVSAWVLQLAGSHAARDGSA